MRPPLSKMDEVELDMLYRVRRTVLEMLKARGYLVTDDLKMELKTFKSEFGESGTRDKLTMLASKKDSQQDQIFVFWADEKKLNAKLIKKFEARMNQHRVKRSIIIVQESITPLSKQCLLAMPEIETFLEAELLVNITKHRYVPKHQVLSDENKKKLLKKYHLKETQLPRIQKDDPISKFYGLTRGQVVKIFRKSETAGRYVTYRIVL